MQRPGVRRRLRRRLAGLLVALLAVMSALALQQLSKGSHADLNQHLDPQAPSVVAQVVATVGGLAQAGGVETAVRTERLLPGRLCHEGGCARHDFTVSVGLLALVLTVLSLALPLSRSSLSINLLPPASRFAPGEGQFRRVWSHGELSVCRI